MSKRNVEFAQFYQAIRVDKLTASNINIRPANPERGLPVGKDLTEGNVKSMVIEEGIGVRIETQFSIVIVPFNNVAYLSLAQEAQAAKKPELKKA